MLNKIFIGFAMTAGLAMAQSGADRIEAFYRTGAYARNETPKVNAKAGETLFHIASRTLGDPYQAAVLQKLNNITDPLAPLKDGQEVMLPKPKWGILYSLQTLAGDDLSEVGPGHKFSPGDRFQLRLTSNFDGYLYLYNLRQDGKLVQIYPGDANRGKRIQGFRDYILPGEDWFRFDNTRQAEEMIVLISEAPLSDLDRNAVADNAVKTRIQSALDSSEKGISVEQQTAESSGGRTVVVRSPDDGGKVFAHRIVLKKQTQD